MVDCYAVLGVSEDASQEEIKEAYRERALECHPDRAEEGEEAAAKEEFVQVRKAFEVLSDPQKRAAYDAAEDEETAARTVEEAQVRRRSYRKAWRANQGQKIHVSQTVLNRVHGLSADHDVVRNRTSLTVPICGGLGMLFYLYEPSAIYASDVFLVDLLLCGAIGGIFGFLIGTAWGVSELVFHKSGG
jgi:curved DNA-binding protein CbpA